MALSGYPSHYYTDSVNTKSPATPNLNLIINDTNSQLINNFMNHLFNVQENFFKVGNKLRKLLECTFATMLMYHAPLINKYGESHIVNKSILRSGREFLVNGKMLLEWGELIRVDWVFRNAKAQSNNVENKALMEEIIKNNEQLKKSNIEQTLELKVIKEEIRDLKSTIDRFEGIFRDIRQHMVGTPSKKRKSDVSPYTEKMYLNI
jgi:hypothetical protein